MILFSLEKKENKRSKSRFNIRWKKKINPPRAIEMSRPGNSTNKYSYRAQKEISLRKLKSKKM